MTNKKLGAIVGTIIIVVLALWYFQSGQWVLEGRETLIIGEYGHNFAYDGQKVRSVDGEVVVNVNNKNDAGSVVATLRNVRHQFSKNETLDGDIRIVMNKFVAKQEFHQGGIAENLWLHGDTGQGPPVMPKLFTFVAGWGPTDIYVNGELVYEDLDGHFMYTEGARREEKITKDDGTFYSPKRKAETGFTDSSAREFHVVVHSKDPDENNFPPHTRWIHLNWQEVAVTKVPADAVLFVPQ